MFVLHKFSFMSPDLLSQNKVYLDLVKLYSWGCGFKWGAGLARCWERSPLTNVSYVSVGFSLTVRLWGFFSSYSGFLRSAKTNISKFQKKENIAESTTLKDAPINKGSLRLCRVSTSDIFNLLKMKLTMQCLAIHNQSECTLYDHNFGCSRQN